MRQEIIEYVSDLHAANGTANRARHLPDLPEFVHEAERLGLVKITVESDFMSDHNTYVEVTEKGRDQLGLNDKPPISERIKAIFTRNN